MGNLPDNQVLEAAAKGDMDALASLDDSGFIIGQDETPKDFTERIRALKKNISKLEDDMGTKGVYEVEGVKVSAKERIPTKIFAEAAQLCRDIFDFGIDWVPGFFIDPSFSFLFGGCAFYFYPDFFAMFIIRRSFRNSENWLIYKRKELIAHELCHIARIGLASTAFEETFAYQTSASPFRRLLGGLFLRQLDSFLFLGSAFALLGAQILRLYIFHSLPFAPFCALPAVVATWLLVRYAFLRRTLARAKANLAHFFHGNAQKALFRCSDAEIRQIAACRNAAQTKAWLDGRHSASLKWQLVNRKYQAKK